MPEFDQQSFHAAAMSIVAAGRELAQLGWTPATSSNFSVRLDAEHAAVTVSGRDKGQLGVDDIMVVDFAGYAHDAGIGCVLHTHSRVQTVASRLYADRGEITLAGFELLKAFRGYDSHEATMRLPVLPNSQDMPELAQLIAPLLASGPPLHGYLIDGHGIYAWGRDMNEARRHLDAFEFLLACELDLRSLRR